jgi:hypothetical protein
VETFSPSVLQNQQLVFHNVYIGKFESSTLMDAPILAHLPEPYVLRLPSPENTYKIALAGNKGMGMFATRDIPTGGLIVVDHPVIVWPLMYSEAMSETHMGTMYQTLVGRLEPSVRREVLNLSNCKSEDECEPVLGILRTNNIAINLRVPDGMHKYAANHRGVFLATSRCNHRLAPSQLILVNFE